MKVNFSSLFKTPVNKYKFFFIYGNDLVVFDRIILFINKKFSCAVEIKSEKELLENTCQQLSLFEERKNKSLNLVYNVSDKILAHVEQLGDGPFIFTSEKARAQSKLVAYFSNSPLSLAIAAYASPLTTSEFDFLAGDMNLPGPFSSLLFKAYQNDYMGLLAALEKIKLYGEVPESAYPSFLESPTLPDDLQPLLHPFLLRNQMKAAEVLSTINPTDVISLLRTLLRSFQILYELMPFKTRPDAISWQRIKPPIFFKDQPIYQSGLSRWTAKQVVTFLETLLALEQQVKYQKSTPAQVSQELIRSLVS